MPLNASLSVEDITRSWMKITSSASVKGFESVRLIPLTRTIQYTPVQ